MRCLFTARPASLPIAASIRFRFPQKGDCLASLVSALLLSGAMGWGAMGWSTSALAQPAPATPAAPTNPAPATQDAPATNAPVTAPAPATPPASDAPAELVQTISQIDAAANQRDLAAVMRFYSPQFTHTDGLTYQTLESTLQQVWQRYPNLTYKTAIDSWKQEGNGYVVETTTTITGNQNEANRPTTLTSTIRSRQRIEGNQIVQQETLAETSQTTSGEKPPSVRVMLPEQVPIGQSFDFDAIVQEPLGNRILLGAVQDEPVAANHYLQTLPVEFEVLSAGGLFKQGRAAAIPGDRWVSGIIVRDDGITTVSQRIHVIRP